MTNHHQAILDFINAGRFVLDLAEMTELPKTVKQLEHAVGSNNLGSTHLGKLHRPQ